MTTPTAATAARAESSPPPSMEKRTAPPSHPENRGPNPDETSRQLNRLNLPHSEVEGYLTRKAISLSADRGELLGLKLREWEEKWEKAKQFAAKNNPGALSLAKVVMKQMDEAQLPLRAEDAQRYLKEIGGLEKLPGPYQPRVTDYLSRVEDPKANLTDKLRGVMAAESLTRQTRGTLDFFAKTRDMVGSDPPAYTAELLREAQQKFEEGRLAAARDLAERARTIGGRRDGELKFRAGAAAQKDFEETTDKMDLGSRAPAAGPALGEERAKREAAADLERTRSQARARRPGGGKGKGKEEK